MDVPCSQIAFGSFVSRHSESRQAILAKPMIDLAIVAWVVEQFVERDVVLEPGQPAPARVGRG
jgi:hypothetical protein